MVIDNNENKTNYSNGAVRCSGNGKGRYDLVPLDILNSYMTAKLDISGDRNPLFFIAEFQKSGDTNLLFYALETFRIERGWNIYELAKHLAIRFEEGEKKYPSTIIDDKMQLNAMRGLPLSSFIDSGTRHYIKWKASVDGYPEDDESHDGAVVWNLIMAIWTMCYKKEMINMHFTGFIGSVLSETSSNAEGVVTDVESKKSE